MLHAMKKLLLLYIIAQSTLSRAEQPIVNFNTCTAEQQELGLCQKLVTDLKDENALLGQKIYILTKQRDAAEAEAARSSNPLLPTWTWVLIGAAVGAGAVIAIKH